MGSVLSRLPVAVSLVCLLAIGASLPVVAQSPSPSFPVAGPPYPEPIEGVSVYDRADVLADETVASLEATIDAVAGRIGVPVVVYTQVKPESETSEEAAADAAALLAQWGIGRTYIGDGLVILLDLTPDRCHGQVRLEAVRDDWLAFLGAEELQLIFEQEMLPLLQECDIDGAVLAAMAAIDAASVSGAAVPETAQPTAAASADVPEASPSPDLSGQPAEG